MKNFEKEMINALNYASDRLKWWADHQTSYLPLLGAIEDVGCTITVTAYSADIYLSGTKEQFLRVFRLLRSAGYEPRKRPKAGDSEFCTSFYKEEFNTIFLSYTSTTCQRVQVGTELKEVPIYKIQCGGEAFTAEELNEQADLP